MDLAERVQPIEQRHPWEVARAALFLRILEQCGALGATRVLDVGAGDAWLAGRVVERLPAEAQVTCWDPNYRDEDLADEQRPPGLRLTSLRPSGVFQGVLILDVIEHVRDDAGFVREVVTGSLEPGGWALVSVPAYQSLYTSHDEALHHVRRYSPRGCRATLTESGLRVEREGSLFTSLLAVRALQAAAERVRGSRHDDGHGVGRWRGGPRLSRSLAEFLGAEGRLLLGLSARGIRLPGLSYWAYCRRR